MAVSGRLLGNFSKAVVFNLKRESFKYCNNATVLRNIGTTLRKNSGKRFSDKHEWVEVSGKIGIVGISNYAQEALGDVVYAQLPEVGASVAQHAECGALESVKAASEVYSPVSGKIVEKNVNVEETPALVNQSCYDKGWLFKIELSNQKELDNLMSEPEYEEFLKKTGEAIKFITGPPADDRGLVEREL